MATKTFTVKIEVSESVNETLFGKAMVRGLQDNDIHYLSYLCHNIVNIEVMPYEEPDREWAVQLTQDGSTTFEFGFRGKQADAEEAARVKHPGVAIVGSYIKE